MSKKLEKIHGKLQKNLNFEKDYNIVLILLDGARYDVISKMPNFQRLSSKGTLFSNMITYGPQTITSLYSIFTGVYGNKTGVNNYFGSLRFKKHVCKTMAQYFQERGFDTSADLLNDLCMPLQGLDSYNIHNEHTDDFPLMHSKLIIEKSKSRDKNFFLFLQYSPIHTNIIKNVIKKNNFDDFNKKYFNEQKANMEAYTKSIIEADNYLGEILNTFDKESLWDNTILFVFSDHGSSTGEKIGELGYGRFCYDYSLKTFASFVQPRIFKVKEISKMCRTIDILPTILEVVDISPPKGFIKIQGKELFSLEKESDSRIAFSEAAGIEKKPSDHPPVVKSIRTSGWKLIYNIESNSFELYNLLEDPKEEKNVLKENTKKAKELLLLLNEIDNSEVQLKY